MMTEKEFIESQNECASMLGMSLSAYQKYCKNLKFSIQEGNDVEESNGNTNNILKYLGIDKSLLKNE